MSEKIFSKGEVNQFPDIKKETELANYGVKAGEIGK